MRLILANGFTMRAMLPSETIVVTAARQKANSPFTKTTRWAIEIASAHVGAHAMSAGWALAAKAVCAIPIDLAEVADNTPGVVTTAIGATVVTAGSKCSERQAGNKELEVED
jgi:hypothetical protein